MVPQPDYPWFGIVQGNTLEQGDLVDHTGARTNYNISSGVT